MKQQTRAGDSSDSQEIPPASRRELFAWAMYDFANSGYTTVVLTAIFNAYFVGVVAGGLQPGTATLLWTTAISGANVIVLISAPLVGAIADHLAIKKRLLLVTTLGCIIGTALLGLAGAGDVAIAMVLVLAATVMFDYGENLIAAFLPEIADIRNMGRISGYAWALGYLGGVLTLGLCLGWIAWASSLGMEATSYVPVTLLITAAVFAAAAAPTFVWLRERAIPTPLPSGFSLLRAGFSRLNVTLGHAARFKDLFRFLVTLSLYQAGVMTVVILAAVYAQEVLGFNSQQLVILILVVNVTSSVGAFAFGHLQDMVGSVRALTLSLGIWIAAVIIAAYADEATDLWLAGNLVGLAMGASQSIGRALVGRFTPAGYSAEFFGLWGMANRLAAIVGPMSYGLVNFWSDGDHRVALISTLFFFVAGLAVLMTVDERRGTQAAHARL